MTHVVDDVIVHSHEIATIHVLQSQFHLEITLVQIHVVIQSTHHEFHRSDAGGSRIDGYHTIAIEGNVRLGYLGQIEAWVSLQIGPRMRDGAPPMFLFPLLYLFWR